MANYSWEKYLFQKHKAVAVSPLKGTRRLQLLDVLVKRPRLLPSGSTVDVVDIGPWYGLGLCDGEDEEDFEVLKNLEEDLKEYVRNLSKGSDDDDVKESGDEMEEPLIICEIRRTIQETVKADSRIIGSLLKLAEFGSTSSEMVTCKLEDVTLHYVDRERLKEARKVWKPDFKQINLHGNPQSYFRGHLDLWLITDILFADKISIDTNQATSKDAGLEAGLDLGVLNPILGVPPPVGVTIGYGNSSGFQTVLTGGNVPFAIRTMLLRYNSTGELIRIGEDGGEKEISFRRAPTPNLYDPVREPLSNMGELFENVPHNEEEDSFTTLAIVLEADEGAA